MSEKRKKIKIVVGVQHCWNGNEGQEEETKGNWPYLLKGCGAHNLKDLRLVDILKS